jgi:hypothetical protein
MSNNKKKSKSRTPSVEETNARLEKEFAQQNSQGQDLPPKEGESKVLDETMQTSSVSADKAEEIVPDVPPFGSDQRPLRGIAGALFPADTHETDEHAKKISCEIFQRLSKKKPKPIFTPG